MTLFDILVKASSQMAHVKTSLQMIEKKYPDTAPVLDPILALLDLPVSPENLAALAAVLPGEILNIARGQIDPRKHAGDAI